MNAAHRAIVWFTGMPDEAPNGCTGNCNQGRACDCELSCDVAPDAERVIAPPVRTPEDHAAIARIRRWAIARALGAIGLLAALLEFFGASRFQL